MATNSSHIVGAIDADTNSTSSISSSNASSTATTATATGNSTGLSSAIKPVTQPEVIKFAYTNFVTDTKDNKWKANCCTCNESITETRGTTTGFARYALQYTTLIYL
jgi:hypothetical protein